MNPRKRISTLALAFCMTASSAAFAQESGQPEGEPEGGETTAAADEAQPAENEGEGEQSPKPPSTAAPSSATAGPGGRPLRTDYPGTPESLKARMDTQQIQGLEGDPDAPQAAYGLRIKELETKVDDLKEKVFQSKTRIVLLRETLLSGNLAGARAIVIHKMDLGAAWKLNQAYYALDGTKLYNRVDKDGDLQEDDVIQVYDGSVAPGNHNLSVLVKYQGTRVGIFPYFRGYDGDIKSSCDFTAKEGKVAQIRVTVFPEGGVAESIEKRPMVRCDVEYFDNIREEGATAKADTTSDE